MILDNLSAHKDAQARKRIEAAGATLMPSPAYSSDFNPIERMWSKIKEHLRHRKARTQQTLEQAIAHALAKVTPQDARAWFNASGYPTYQN